MSPTCPGRFNAGFSWVKPPILNQTTRLSVITNSARGGLTVRGWEDDDLATKIFTL